ncbi:winged helix-turn-helix domain-containing protein [Amycolatopsis sp. QT-25]|uniref:winged helix-turn-helix domain-containing protein n=1 Tax=Amycolatopsis sp. QT-25 TaxID=3034022 RepID=UPI0023EC62AE|nr:winged helix-turn-helix domain-containing protein [Amycolatopsis sp. QT-25]WET81080.1 winged helix-turn-helix domain-containing protein [Amycolatopsis sp. QT-25]
MATTGCPKYLQLADDLRGRIAAGTYPVGSPLPSTSRLMSEHDVSVTVVRDALKELKRDGVVAGQPGKAVYVEQVPDAPAPTPDYAGVMRQIEDLRGAVESVAERLAAVEDAVRADRSRSTGS